MDRAAVADLLLSRRNRLHPADVGLPAGARRRTPGLRRDEVAALAAISPDYYARLEQQRGAHPSAAVLAALARALRMTDAERDHLFHLAGLTPPRRSAVSSHVSPGMLHVLHRLTDSPAYVVGDLGEAIVQNAMSIALSGDALAYRGRARSFTWRWFTDPAARLRFPEEDWPVQSRTHVADLRATYGRRGSDPEVASFVTDLLAGSREFAELWARRDVALRRAESKRIVHPEVGLVDLLCETLVSAGSGQTLVMMFPRPGTDAREKLDLLRVIGTQDLPTSR